jgi:hypothetical protein
MMASQHSLTEEKSRHQLQLAFVLPSYTIPFKGSYLPFGTSNSESPIEESQVTMKAVSNTPAH